MNVYLKSRCGKKKLAGRARRQTGQYLHILRTALGRTYHNLHVSTANCLYVNFEIQTWVSMITEFGVVDRSFCNSSSMHISKSGFEKDLHVAILFSCGQTTCQPSDSHRRLNCKLQAFTSTLHSETLSTNCDFNFKVLTTYCNLLQGLIKMLFKTHYGGYKMHLSILYKRSSYANKFRRKYVQRAVFYGGASF